MSYSIIFISFVPRITVFFIVKVAVILMTTGTLRKTVSKDLRVNQNDMTCPNSVALFAQTLVCSLCNYYLDYMRRH